MQYIVNPIAFILKWSFDHILVPLGELPALINPNTLFWIIIVTGLITWLFMQRRYNEEAANNPNQLK